MSGCAATPPKPTVPPLRLLRNLWLGHAVRDNAELRRPAHPVHYCAMPLLFLACKRLLSHVLCSPSCFNTIFAHIGTHPRLRMCATGSRNEPTRRIEALPQT